MDQIEGPMAKKANRTYSLYTREALALFAVLIRTARLEKKMPAQELAERAGISRGLLQRIEKGDASCTIGAVFEVASILGISLFDSDEKRLTGQLTVAQERLSLMPKMARKPQREIDDDF